MKFKPGTRFGYACDFLNSNDLNHSYVLPKVFFILIMTLFFLCFSSGIYAQTVSTGKQHSIKMVAEEIEGGYLAYRMMQHEIVDATGTTDVTSRYSEIVTIPGPTIVISEGDIVDIELFHAIDPSSPEQEHVSLHVHGVHYDIISDGTLKYINLFKDESATPAMSYIYRWNAAPGTAGTWAYHDHNFNTHNGAEDRGLFGALIVNPASDVVSVHGSGQQQSLSLSNIDKDYVLYITDDTFVGMEIDNANNQKQTPLWVNPTLTANKNTFVRFHLIALGTNTHQFELPGYEWLDPGTRKTIGRKSIGPLEKHVFTVLATRDAVYMDTTFSSKLLGMQGIFQVNN